MITSSSRVRTGIFRTHPHVGRKLTRLPFGDRLAIDAIPLGENGVFLLASLDRFSNAWGGRRRAVRSTRQLSASFSFSSHARFPRTVLAKRPSCAKGRTRSKELMGPLSRQDGRPRDHLLCELTTLTPRSGHAMTRTTNQPSASGGGTPHLRIR